MLQQPKCKKERRVGTKLFLKAERCSGPKCGVIRSPVKPGFQPTKRKRGRGITEYGQMLLEKQKIQWSYFIDEKYLKKVFRRAKKAKGVTPLKIYNALERRLDNVVYRGGFALGRAQARQMVSHGHFAVNGRKITIPSTEIKIGDTIAVRPSARKLSALKELRARLKTYAPPEWLKLDKDNLTSQVIREPEINQEQLPFNFPALVEYFSR